MNRRLALNPPAWSKPLRHGEGPSFSCGEKVGSRRVKGVARFMAPMRVRSWRFSLSKDLRPFRITAVILGLAIFTLAEDLGSRTATQWSPCVEWRLDNPDWEGNPFDVVATVEFTHDATKEKHRTAMFYLGGHRWAFRFTGTEPGRWSFSSSSDDPDLDGHTGAVVVKPNPNPKAHGFLKNLNGKWGWEGPQTAFVPQLVMWDYVAGSNNPLTFHDQPDLVDAKIEEFIGRHGFTGFHVPVVAGRWFDIEAETDRVGLWMENPDPRTFEALELLITKTHKAGGMVHIWPWGDHQRRQTPRSLQGGMGGPVDQRLQRYLAARLGPIPGWSMGYGFDLDEWVTAEQLRHWHDAMHRWMGWSHFLGGRPAGPNRGTDHTTDAQWNAGLDYSSYEHHRPTYEVYLAAVKATPGQPVFSEDRFRVRVGKYPEKDYDPELTRRGLYNSTMAGGVANIWGIHPALSAGGIYPNRDQLKTYSVFFNEKRRFLPDMVLANHRSTDARTRILWSQRSRSLIIYRESADSVTVDLSGVPAGQPVVAVDTKKPYAEIVLGRSTSTQQRLELPSVSDWVMAVGGLTSSANPD